MELPEIVSVDDMPLRMKEWTLAGVGAHWSADKSKIVVISPGGERGNISEVGLCTGHYHKEDGLWVYDLEQPCCDVSREYCPYGLYKVCESYDREQ